MKVGNFSQMIRRSLEGAPDTTMRHAFSRSLSEQASRQPRIRELRRGLLFNDIDSNSAVIKGLPRNVIRTAIDQIFDNINVIPGPGPERPHTQRKVLIGLVSEQTNTGKKCRAILNNIIKTMLVRKRPYIIRKEDGGNIPLFFESIKRRYGDMFLSTELPPRDTSRSLLN